MFNLLLVVLVLFILSLMSIRLIQFIFFQIWVILWKCGLIFCYYICIFFDEEKCKGFVKILFLLKVGEDVIVQEEKDVEFIILGMIFIYVDLVMGVGFLVFEVKFEWMVGVNVIKQIKRKVFVYFIMIQKGKVKIRIDGCEGVELNEGDGVFVEVVNVGDKFVIESIGVVEVEVVILDIV